MLQSFPAAVSNVSVHGRGAGVSAQRRVPCLLQKSAVS